MDFKCIELKDVDWTYLAQDMDYWLTLVNTEQILGSLLVNASNLTQLNIYDPSSGTMLLEIGWLISFHNRK